MPVIKVGIVSPSASDRLLILPESVERTVVLEEKSEGRVHSLKRLWISSRTFIDVQLAMCP